MCGVDSVKSLSASESVLDFKYQIAHLAPWPSNVTGTKYIYMTRDHCVCPLVGIGTPPPHPLSRKRVSFPPEPKGGVVPACEGVGESQFGRLERKLSTLSTLWLQVKDYRASKYALLC
jgi:hypothetical protein